MGRFWPAGPMFDTLGLVAPNSQFRSGLRAVVGSGLLHVAKEPQVANRRTRRRRFLRLRVDMKWCVGFIRNKDRVKTTIGLS